MDDRSRIDDALARLLPTQTAPATLAEAMRHAVLGGGKRIRPRLVHAAGTVAGAAPAALDHAAAAVEFIHASSLVHDDLPAMDDDALRRGKPTVHARFGEAIGILTGDALQSAAFATLAAAPAEAAVVRRWVQLLAAAAGAGGMAGGQTLDIESAAKPATEADLEARHHLKTGALIRASVAIGAAAGTLSEAETTALDAYGAAVGLGFQIQDDVLNATGTARLGKPHGSDARRGLPTYASVHGVAGAQAAARRQLQRALDAIAPFGGRAEPLAALAQAMIERSR